MLHLVNDGGVGKCTAVMNSLLTLRMINITKKTGILHMTTLKYLRVLNNHWQKFIVFNILTTVRVSKKKNMFENN